LAFYLGGKKDPNIGFQERRQFFSPKWAKIAENSDRNIDPWKSCALNRAEYINSYID
jgi:hypothetical protein